MERTCRLLFQGQMKEEVGQIVSHVVFHHVAERMSLVSVHGTWNWWIVEARGKFSDGPWILKAKQVDAITSYGQNVTSSSIRGRFVVCSLVYWVSSSLWVATVQFRRLLRAYRSCQSDGHVNYPRCSAMGTPGCSKGIRYEHAFPRLVEGNYYAGEEVCPPFDVPPRSHFDSDSGGWWWLRIFVRWRSGVFDIKFCVFLWNCDTWFELSQQWVNCSLLTNQEVTCEQL